MSLMIRHLTNGEKTVYTVRNAGVDPVSFEIFNKREDIDERIRHYAPTGEPVFCLPDLARTFGVLDLFYPNHPINLNCAMLKHKNKKCIWESCRYNIDSKEPERGTCPRTVIINSGNETEISIHQSINREGISKNEKYLFRGKRIDNGKWCEGYLSYDREGRFAFIRQAIGGGYKSSKHTKWDDIEIVPNTVGKCTGIKQQKPSYDKYFYEGDIVNAYWYDDDGNLVSDIMVIHFHEGELVGLSTTNHEPRRVWDIAYRGGEIVGNIHDNPELLNREKVEENTCNRYCFTQDNDGHWYCIPVKKKRKFYKWVKAMEHCDDYNEDFEDYRTQLHISNYSFENMEEI